MTSTNSSDASIVGSSTPIQNVPVAADTKDRVRASKEQRRIILAEFERSGVSAAPFAELTALNVFDAGGLGAALPARQAKGTTAGAPAGSGSCRGR